MRLIDADALVRTILTHDEVKGEGVIAHNSPYYISLAIALINNAPTVNAMVLPCAVGDTLYVLDKERNVSGGHDNVIDEYTVDEIRFDETYFWVHGAREKMRGRTFKIPEGLGKTVYLTRKEAEAALERMKQT